MSETPDIRAGGNATQPIVVGVDGSDCSNAALRWAAEQARVTNRPLRAVSAWQFPTLYGTVAALPPDMDLADDARTVLEESVEKVLGIDQAGSVEQVVVEGRATAVLRDESTRAALLVVGSRGHGEIVGMLIGSVSEFLAAHASCPVVIVRCATT